MSLSSPTMFPNAHTHLHTDSFAIRNIIVGNEAEENLVRRLEKGLFSVGIHPWYLPQNIDIGLSNLYTLATMPQVLAIGECGLDRLKAKDLSLQIPVFEQQISIAQQLNKPLIVHCVRAFSEFLGIKKKWNIQVPVIIHGFNQNPQILTELLKQGCYVSMGASLLNTQSWASRNINDIPLDRLLLETDHADLPILAIFVAASERLGLPIEELQNQIQNNFRKVFLPTNLFKLFILIDNYPF